MSATNLTLTPATDETRSPSFFPDSPDTRSGTKASERGSTKMSFASSQRKSTKASVRSSIRSMRPSVIQRPPVSLPIEGMPGLNMSHIRQAFEEIDYERDEYIDVSELRYFLTVLAQATYRFEPGEMGVTADEKGFVKSIKKDGQARSKGILVGDQIAKIGTEPYSALALSAAEQSGLSYELVVSGEQPTDEEIEEMILMVDLDGKGRAHWDDFLSLFGDRAIIEQMLTMRPMTKTRKSRQPMQSSPSSWSQASPTSPTSRMSATSSSTKPPQASKREVDLTLKTFASLMSMCNHEMGPDGHIRKIEKPASTLPEAKAPWAGAHRARPEPPREPLPLSPRAAGQLQKEMMRRGLAPPPGFPGMLPQDQTHPR